MTTITPHPARLRPPRRQLWQAPMFFVGLATLVGVCVARPTWREGDLRQMQRDLDRARQVVGQHRADPSEVAPLAERLAAQAGRHPEQGGDIHFLVGSLYIRLAERAPAAALLDAWSKARFHLEEAQTLGVPEADFPRLTYLVAKAWYHTNGDMQDVIEFLERSIDGGTDHPAEGYAMLADAYLRLPKRDVEAALAANEKELAVPYVGEDLLAPARLLRGQLLLELKRTDEARRVLANIGIQAPSAVLAQARFLRALSLQVEEHWAEAESVWKETLEDRAVPPREPARVLYYLGVCYRKQNQPGEAARVWAECAQRGDAGDVAPAALVQLAELQLTDADPTPVVDTLERAFRDLKDLADWHNPLVDVNRVRDVFDSGCAALRKHGRFDQAIRLALLYEPFALEGKAHAQLGRSAHEWGERGLKAARDGGGQPAPLEEARAKLRQAGEAFEKASELTSRSAERMERLWLAVESYADGKETARTIAAVKALIELARALKMPLDPQRQGKAWFVLAEAYRELGQETLALHAYGECINYRSPYAYRARYYQALAEVEKKNIDEARKVLEQNLHLLHEEDNPDREAHEQTLYALARLLYDSHDYSAAATHYKQALDKFRDNADALPALHQLADCYRELAGDELKAIGPNDRAAQATKDHHVKEYRRYLRLAAEKYHELTDELGKRAAGKPLTKEEAILQWQAQINAALCYYYGERVPEAKALFEQLAARYEGKTEQLYALRGIANCYWATDNPGNKALAVETVQKIRTLLAKLSDAELSIGPKSLDRRAWEAWLDQVSKKPASPMQ